MPKVLEEVTDQAIDRSHVARRVDEWVARIGALYRQIEDWLPEGWTLDQKQTTRMHEELMRRFDVPPRELPVLRLFYKGTPSARIEPRELWIIGANGRLDFFRENDHYLIIDTAENFAPPDWHIAPFADRRNLRKLTRDTFTAVL